MPNADHKKSQDNGAAGVTENLPEMWPHKRNKKSRKEERYSGKHGSLALAVLASVPFEDLVNNSVPSRLGSQISGTLSVRVTRTEDGAAANALSGQLLVVVSALLGIDEDMIGLRQQREIAGGAL